MALQGLAQYPGISQVVAGRYTRGLRTYPGWAILEIIPQAEPIAATGTLLFTFDGNFVSLPKCRVDFGTMQWSSKDGQTAVIKIWDRRWAWWVRDSQGNLAGEISGRYNARRVDGSLDPSTEKTPQQLAELLLQAMGEGAFSVSSLPNTTRPYVDWEHAHPATELESLCQLLGCVPALKIATDTVEIVRPGVGNPLPTTDLFRFSQSGNLAEAPDRLKVVGDARFQSKLKLRAVGLDTDGNIKPINSLSYAPGAPAGDWSGVDHRFFTQIGEDSGVEQQQLALRTVWRWYQIVSQADGTQFVPGFLNVQDIENIKPIDDFLIQTYTDANGNVLPQAAYVEGVFRVMDQQGAQQNSAAGTKFEGEWSLDRENGVIKFPQAVFKIDAATKEEAELYLTCSYRARYPVSKNIFRYIQERNLGGTNGTGPLIIRRPDLLYTAYGQYNGTALINTVTNLIDVQNESNAQFDATQLEFGGSVAYDAGYNGIQPIDVDGLTRQVTFRVESRDRSPRGGAETYVSVNSETDPYVPRWRKRQVDYLSRRSPRRQRFPR